MPRALLEKDIEKKVTNDARKLGITYAIKLELRTDAGWPDRLFLIPGGRPLFIEFKRQGEVPRPLQSYRLRELRDLGYDAVWADNYHDAMAHITRAMGAASRPEEGGKIPS